MSTDSLPLYSDDKKSLMDDVDDDGRFDGLQVGQPSFTARLRDRWTAMGFMKKGLIAFLAFFALVHLLHGPIKHVTHGRHSRPVMTWENDLEDWSPSDETWEPYHVSLKRMQ